MIFTQAIALIYRKIPIISPGLILVQKAFLLGLFSGEHIFGRLIIGGTFVFQNWLGLTIKLKQLKRLQKQAKTAENS